MEAKRRERVLMIAAGVCVGTLALWMLVVTPLVDHWKTVNDEIATLETRIRRGEALLRSEPAMRAEWEQMQQRSLAADATKATDDVVKAVERWTQVSGFNRSSLLPRWTAEDRERALLDVRVTGQGTIQQIARFLYELEADPLALKLEEAVITTGNDNSGRNLTLSARFTGLQLRDTQLRAPAPARRGTAASRGSAS